MHVGSRIAVVGGALALLVGCPAPQGASLQPLPDARYATYIHPLFEGSCATLDCHGDEGRPLRLYSETGLRITDDLRTAPGEPTIPVTAEELVDNVHAIAIVDVDHPIVEERFLLLKPLSNVGGGVHHYGGRIWTGVDDPAYRCVRSWLEGAIDAPACDEAVARDGLPPP
ncbi:MAG: hypothetical protein AB7S26_17760 [Sandaracinaceae bacterium]